MSRSQPSARRTVPPPLEAATDPLVAAKVAGLRYVTDDRPGIRRIRAGHGFRYVDPDGRPVRDPDELRRIRSLAIPPAWTDVWVCPLPNGHLQATGRDARGRKQYRYHPRWREVRDETKYDRAVAFGQALPLIRARTEEHLGLPGLPREKVLATVVRLLERTHVRVGNEEYAQQNGSFGLTTLRDHHATIRGSTVRFRFKGKSGVRHEIALTDRRLARVVRRCQDLPGAELFQYVDEDGVIRSVDSADVNEYLREISGQEFTAKDFRTWAGTVLAARELAAKAACDSEAEAKRNVVAAVEAVARQLGNTKAVCRKCYVHPAVIEAYLAGRAIMLAVAAATAEEVGAALRAEEKAVLELLRSAGGAENKAG
jgi:DNA topoisomerase-1